LEDGYIYRQPILVTPQSIHQGHSMGMTLQLILTFNLALVHHLIVSQSKTICGSSLRRVLKLYELAYLCQVEEHENDQLVSIRFSMILANNLGEIYRVVGDRSKYVQCLQQLLSTMMFLMACTEDNNGGVEMDGFRRNTSQLILQAKCAAAA
jgi:hypothetical protein